MRVETITRELYQFDELDDKAKEKARDWLRELVSQDFEPEFVLDDVVSVATILGIEIATHTVRGHKCEPRQERTIHWSGFSSQGDGASYAGSYKHRPEALAEIKAYAPKDEKLHLIATRLDEVAEQVSKLGHGSLAADITLMPSRYSHSNTMQVDLEWPDESEPETFDEKAFRAVESELQDVLRSFADWIYGQLESAYYYSLSNESIDETIRANEYEFLKSGARA